MNPYRYFLWVSDESRSAELQIQGARVCEASIETHHAHYALLLELTPAQAVALSKTQGDAR